MDGTFAQETQLALYYASIYPHLNYCIHVWDIAYSIHEHDLIVLQTKAGCIAMLCHQEHMWISIYCLWTIYSVIV